MKVDVQQYEVEHLKVSQLENKLVISAKHEARADDHGFVSREFTREFLLHEVCLTSGKLYGFIYV